MLDAAPKYNGLNIVHTGNPCNMHLVRSTNRVFPQGRLTSDLQKLDLAKKIKEGCKEEGLVGLIFNTIGVRYVVLLHRRYSSHRDS